MKLFRLATLIALVCATAVAFPFGSSTKGGVTLTVCAFYPIFIPGIPLGPEAGAQAGVIASVDSADPKTEAFKITFAFSNGASILTHTEILPRARGSSRVTSTVFYVDPLALQSVLVEELRPSASQSF